MKLMDEKGKLFGIINIIDLAVLVLIIAIAASAGYKIIGSKLKDNEENLRDIMVTIKCSFVTETTAKLFKKGDRFLTGSNYVNGVVDSSWYTEAYDTVKTADGKILWEKHPYLKNVFIIVKMHENPDNPILTLGSQEIRVGKPVFMKTQRVELSGIVEDIKVIDK
ncbi:MAG: DUF4330 domain-containing protein [Clostridiales bacterium]|nr:DUF4330 domain-containing protein [Clostridiales bacterium]